MSNPHSGNIRNTPLSDVLERLRRGKATGTLTVRSSSNDIVKSLSIVDGQIVFASSTDIRDRLGEILVRSGKLTREKLDHALQLYRDNAGLKKFGAILVENEFVHPKDLFSSLKTQVKDVIYSLFLWSEGDYSFEARLSSEIIHLQLDFQELIAEIIQRIKKEA
ncbi:MAG TPA: DUF4388 domain-containing protein [Nitrospirota bacterium]